MSTPIPKKSVFERFPNRYTGGYLGSTVTEKLKYTTLVAVRKSRQSPNLNMFSNMGELSQPASVAAAGICKPS